MTLPPGSEDCLAGGAVTQTYWTDEFGVPYLTQGASAQPFRFTGEQRDGETGFECLRARYYLPSLGRFLSRDPIFGSVSNPLTLNRLAYALDGPATLGDASGLSTTYDGVPPTSTGSLAKADNECFSTLGGSLVFYGINARCTGIESDCLAVTFVEGPEGELLAILAYQMAAPSGGCGSQKPEIHHIATDKGIKSGWTARFTAIFAKAGMTLQDAANKVAVPGHYGPAPRGTTSLSSTG
jgi:RHS repeat-associated protein